MNFTHIFIFIQAMPYKKLQIHGLLSLIFTFLIKNSLSIIIIHDSNEQISHNTIECFFLLAVLSVLFPMSYCTKRNQMPNKKEEKERH